MTTQTQDQALNAFIEEAVRRGFFQRSGEDGKALTVMPKCTESREEFSRLLIEFRDNYHA